jgi:hypothetical protein
LPKELDQETTGAFMTALLIIPASLLGFLAAVIQVVWFDATLAQAALMYFGVGIALPTALLAAYAVSAFFAPQQKEPRLI